MNGQAYKINSRITSGEKEYLLQTVNDPQHQRVLCSVFSDGELLETSEEQVNGEIKTEELQHLVRTAHEEKRRELEQLVELYKNSATVTDPFLMLYLGQTLFYRKMYPEAEKLLLRAIELDPNFHEGWHQLGAVQFAMQRFAEGCQSLSKAAELKPTFADYRNALGESYLALDSCKRAVIEFEEALKLNVYYGEAYLNLALAFILNSIRREDFSLFAKQGEKTNEMLQKASVIMPDIVDQDFLEAQKFLQHGNLEKAFAKLLKCREKRRSVKQAECSNFYLKFLLGTEQLNEKNLTRRIKYLQESLNQNPHYADLHYELAIAYTLLGRFIHSKAIEEYKKALSINPDFERARKNLKLAENELKGFDVIIKAITKG